MIRLDSDDRQLAERAKQIYEANIRARVEPEHHGEFVIVDVDSGDYEVGADKLEAFDRLQARRPHLSSFLLRVGYPTAARLGGRRVHPQ